MITLEDIVMLTKAGFSREEIIKAAQQVSDSAQASQQGPVPAPQQGPVPAPQQGPVPALQQGPVPAPQQDIFDGLRDEIAKLTAIVQQINVNAGIRGAPVDNTKDIVSNALETIINGRGNNGSD